jgi:hypothetical protein
MTNIEVTLTAAHLAYVGYAVGSLIFLGILYWLRKYLFVVLFWGAVAMGAIGVVKHKVSSTLEYRNFARGQVQQLPAEFGSLYNVLKECKNSGTRQLALDAFMQARDEQSPRITPFQYEAFLALSRTLGDAHLRQLMETKLSDCVDFNFEELEVQISQFKREKEPEKVGVKVVEEGVGLQSMGMEG